MNLNKIKNYIYTKDCFFIIVGLLLLVSSIIVLFITSITGSIKIIFFIFALTAFTAAPDIKKTGSMKDFLKTALPYTFFIVVILIFGNDIWHNVLRLQMKMGILIDLNSLFNSIPLNDAAFIRIFHPAWLTSYMQFVYNTGFVLAVIIPFYRAFLTLDFKKMLSYSFSSHMFQVFLITPLYFLFHLREVWYVKGDPDMLLRNLSPQQALEVTLNCMPSMHTSIAFAMLILVMREKSKAFKYLWGFYCVSVIYSTMYLKVHWVLDVAGGIAFACAIVILSDFVIERLSLRLRLQFKNSDTNINYMEDLSV